MIYGVVICKGKSLLVDIASKKVKNTKKSWSNNFHKIISKMSKKAPKMPFFSQKMLILPIFSTNGIKYDVISLNNDVLGYIVM